MNTKTKEWAVDYEVEVEVTLHVIVTVSRSGIHEGATAEEAIERAKEDAHVDESDIDLDVIEGFLEVDPDYDTFKVESVSEWDPA